MWDGFRAWLFIIYLTERLIYIIFRVMHLSLAFIEERLAAMGSQIEPRTHARDRDGFKPNVQTMGDIGMRLNHIYGADHIEFAILERTGDGSTLGMRSFPYTREELAEIAAALESRILLGDESLALEWNSLQIRRALLVLRDVPRERWAMYSMAHAADGQFCRALSPGGEDYRPVGQG